MKLDPGLRASRILIVEDNEANTRFLLSLLDHGGYDYVWTATTGVEALSVYAAISPDLVLLDLHLPGSDGYEVLRALRQRDTDLYLPILVFTADATQQTRKATLELGASDFLTKPGDATEILLRINNFLAMRSWSRLLKERNSDLETKVRERTMELEESQIEIVERLALAGEHRDDSTGQHTTRVGQLSGQIAAKLGFSETFVTLIAMAARLHDLGKVGIPDSILLKPDKLTAQEFAAMQAHCMIGAHILSKSRTPLLKMAERIAAAHHERYDGAGYPAGLSGDDIPIEAGIVAVADVFDALTNERPYKAAWGVPAAIREITAQSGRHFHPKVVEAFLAVVGSAEPLRSSLQA